MKTMALVLREDDAKAVLTMPSTIAVVEAAFRERVLGTELDILG